jgi:hypothetical protein
MKFDLTIHDVETYAAEPLMHLANLLSEGGVSYDDLLEGATEAVHFVLDMYWDQLATLLDGAADDSWAQFRTVLAAVAVARNAMLENPR